jgi:hypothetical protein
MLGRTAGAERAVRIAGGFVSSASSIASVRCTIGSGALVSSAEAALRSASLIAVMLFPPLAWRD